MKGRWLTVSATITRIWTETGYLLTGDDVLRLGKRKGAWGLVVETSHEHTRVSEESVDAHIVWLNAPKVARPTVGGGPHLPAFIEDEYQRSKDQQ
ncbi:hypothetical protein [Nonomuraea wenchangensis]|uniref:Uncharacterized protein n=1 Tax=Nonomuraea wenchangensis TaxID=568860 RepID=A0A1I0F4M7_9ACTN|nr:hypothetical protein [Nonomuraea wenchangensis]SET52356.1 hypothetical protein SAMN05421811_103304 [Nonomuraea wenchangensis]